MFIKEEFIIKENIKLRVILDWIVIWYVKTVCNQLAGYDIYYLALSHKKELKEIIIQGEQFYYYTTEKIELSLNNIDFKTFFI